MTNLPPSSSGQLNLAESSLFIDAGLPWPLPAGTTIKCIVSAAGRIDDEIWGEIDGVIDLSTASISIEEPAESASKFVGSLTLNLSDIITTDANASVQITDDNYDNVVWKVSSRQETTPSVPSGARFFTDMKPVVHWLDQAGKTTRKDKRLLFDLQQNMYMVSKESCSLLMVSVNQ